MQWNCADFYAFVLAIFDHVAYSYAAVMLLHGVMIVWSCSMCMSVCMHGIYRGRGLLVAVVHP